jgi:hypothetical protein
MKHNKIKINCRKLTYFSQDTMRQTLIVEILLQKSTKHPQIGPPNIEHE